VDPPAPGLFGEADTSVFAVPGCDLLDCVVRDTFAAADAAVTEPFENFRTVVE
jgi:hypothetical protein